ncbi:MAG TPA: hypothetical protein VEY12_08150 [Thermoplasmata archaeon]|nr:hypothetical protein [Thermoplasmata archaeon]
MTAAESEGQVGRRGLLGRAVDKVREINHKYAKPRIKMSRGVKFALLMLRLYLIFLVGLLLFRLITGRG